MNKATLKKLKQNPHYKLSAKQEADLNEENREEMISFGTPPAHQSNFQTHQTSLKRKRFTADKSVVS